MLGITDTPNKENVKNYRVRLKKKGVKRVELTVPASDVSLLRDIAAILRSGGDEAVLLRNTIEKNTQQRTGRDLIHFFQSSPLFGADIDLERDKSTSRTVTFE